MLGAALQMLNFEVLIRRNDPNAKAVLLRAAEAPAIDSEQLRAAAQLATKLRHPELARIALSRALDRVMDAPRGVDYTEAALLTRWLMALAPTRADARTHLEVAQKALSHFSPASCPLDHDVLQNFLSEAWNCGVAAFRERAFAEVSPGGATRLHLSFLSLAFDALTNDLAVRSRVTNV